jgi:hypothetical protein
VPQDSPRVSRRSVLVGGSAVVATLALPEMLKQLSWIPDRVAIAATAAASSLPDVQFDLSPYMPAARTFDGILAAMPPVQTIFLTARLSRAPSKADAGRMESALSTIEANYPYAPGGVLTHVSYSDNYFNRLPASVVSAHMPKTIAFGQQAAGQPARPTWRRETGSSPCGGPSSPYRSASRTTTSCSPSAATT